MFKRRTALQVASLLSSVCALAACRAPAVPASLTAAPPGACQGGDLLSRNSHDNGTDLFGVVLGWDKQELFTAVSLRGAARGDHPLTLRQDGEALKARDGAGAESTDLSGVTLLGLRPSGGGCAGCGSRRTWHSGCPSSR